MKSKASLGNIFGSREKYCIFNMLTRDTFTAPFAHHIFYSKLILKASIFPALGFSLLLKCEKYLLVMSQGQDPSGFAKCAPHVPYRDPPCHTGKAYHMSMQSFPQSIVFPPENGEKMLLGQKKTSPVKKQPPPHPVGTKNHHRAAGSSYIRTC